jgi:hypothetical protein
MASDILRALDRDGLPATMESDGLRIYLNRDSGYVFLSDSDYNVAVVDGSRLVGHYSSPYDGHEGTFSELVEILDDTWNSEDVEWLHDVADVLGRSDELPAIAENDGNES